MNQIELYQAVRDLESKSRELARLLRLKILRNGLKLLLIGFLIWRDIDKRILGIARAARRNDVSETQTVESPVYEDYGVGAAGRIRTSDQWRYHPNFPANSHFF